ncbi:hypothetical protein [Lysinibacillus sphaericus]|uniref:hypothetical protein n=1 Tax=Lysinibacillus sphaericus TaxID=1421 RepID=UPI0018CDF195|nr:hypothetical protein [Lysinibacillus sphaericus]
MELSNVWKILEWIVNKLDRRESVAKLSKAEDLVISNASLEDIKRGIRKIYKEVNLNDNK